MASSRSHKMVVRLSRCSNDDRTFTDRSLLKYMIHMCLFGSDAKFNLTNLVERTDRLFLFDFLKGDNDDIDKWMGESLGLI